ncbi:MAG: peptidoglycan-binding domain-containing protein [Bryobacteraceae bacterium]|jgi:peptidoglycan hydrolase-like protein with peptidoglycan-binding domain
MKLITTATVALALGMLGLNLVPTASATSHKEAKTVQKSLSDKGFYNGPIDGLVGPQTRAGIRQYQEAEGLPVTGRLDEATAGKLGVGPESIGGGFKGAGQEVGKGGQEVGHEMKQGKPLAAGKEFGKGMGRAGEKVGKAVKKSVTTDSDRGDREKKQ